mmetsp:Transcript_22509/g.31322  ORF Transcript_22509/g.31322 Transcript_22509/m.31322 type:complete len:392 (+) Transcript_22509:222-1397(+)|eukprot:CAMPEP_0196581292 /NCGR_PEP_ID=MMETSP1081-20130531/33474_1 /TAXON_ID=36882 /ORGANISM="Pyramimonas amylifera, Strain CCMP720" /LENGTH=391 /DNA_ID=CAMNT_0041901473 /DNA_START=206 /DNA_END=1381 /DNA_ORIENTATION=+
MGGFKIASEATDTFDKSIIEKTVDRICFDKDTYVEGVSPGLDTENPWSKEIDTEDKRKIGRRQSEYETYRMSSTKDNLESFTSDSFVKSRSTSLYTAPSVEGAHDNKTISVLLVDDMVSVLLQYKQYLRKAVGCQVSICKNGIEALTMMKSQVFSVVFMDLAMPLMNGRECVKELRAWESEVGRTARQFVVALFGSVDFDNERKELQTIGFDDAACKETNKELVMKHTIFHRVSNYNAKFMSPDKKMCTPSSVCDDLDTVIQHSENKNVLVVDDCTAIRLLYQRRLKKMGLVVHTASNGAEALEQLKKITFLIVFMDLSMPIMNGKDCVKALREYEASAGTERQHVVAVFAFDGANSIEDELLAIGFNGTEVKNNDRESILRHLTGCSSSL